MIQIGVIARGRARVRRAAGRCAAALGVATLVIAACDGENLFESGPGGLDEAPPSVEIVQPADNGTVPVGDSILVEVNLADDFALASVEVQGVAVRGTGEELVRFEPDSSTIENGAGTLVHTTYLQPTADGTKEPVLIIATATDRAGNIAADTVEVYVGGPQVELRLPIEGQELQIGGATFVQAFASDETGISAMWLVYYFQGDSTRIDFPAVSGDSVLQTVTISPLPSDTGTMRLEAWARNATGIAGKDDVAVRLVTEPPVDSVGPAVRWSVNGSKRLEFTDSIGIDVDAVDPLGVISVGVTVLGIRSASADTLVYDSAVSFSQPITGNALETFRIMLGDLFAGIQAMYPDTITLQVHAYAYDTNGTCGISSIGDGEPNPCSSRQVEGTNYTMAPIEAGVAQTELIAVAGRTVLLPAGGTIADAVIDPVRQNLYLSNIERNRIEVLDMADTTFIGGGISVGAEPWGMFIDGTGNTLIVANSFSKNFAFVDLIAQQEDVSRRLRTPDIRLYQINISVSETLEENYALSDALAFSDRPQFVVEDALGQLLYSTVPSSAAGEGTIRKVVNDPTWEQAEVELLFYPVTENPNALSIARVDSVHILPQDVGDDQVVLFDHMPGFPNTIISNPPATVNDACSQLAGLGSDVLCIAGAWDPETIGMSDTTYIAASGDRNVIAFGEGATAPVGRIFLWDATSGAVSSDANVQDLIDDAAERVLGLGLNQDGTLGVASGEGGAYFFNDNLELEGGYRDESAEGGMGAVLHPNHPANYSAITASDLTTLAFVGTSSESIKVIDTIKFCERGEIHIRDDIAGPLRVSPPLAGENSGLTTSDPEYLIGYAYGVTSAGGVVILDIRRRDVRDVTECAFEG